MEIRPKICEFLTIEDSRMWSLQTACLCTVCHGQVLQAKWRRGIAKMGNPFYVGFFIFNLKKLQL
jgi:hypothetical protein